MTKRFFAWMATVGICSMLQAQISQPAELAYKVKNEAFNQSQVDSIARFMTDNLGPRLAASKMKLRAEEKVVDKLKSLGFDNVRVEFASDFKKGGWDNEKNYVAMTAPYYCSFAANPKAWSGSTDGLVKAQCILLEANDTTDLAKYKGKLGGKIVLMPPTREYELSFRPMAKRYTDEELAEMSKDTRPNNSWGRRGAGNPAAKALRNAIDSLIKLEAPLAVIVGDGTFNIPGSRGVNYKVGDAEPVPEIVLPIEDHGRMVRLIKSGENVEMELDVQNTFTDNQKINNIIAEIPGTDPKLKNEVVLIGAHLDSWHGGTGGADNASGCITMIEAMRILKSLGVKPRRTIRLALWGGEEQGLYGSKGYAKNNLFNSDENKKLPGYDDFALYLNMDFGSGKFKGVYLEENDMAYPYFEAWKQPLVSLGFDTFSPRKVGSTDHVSFSRLGLPAYQFIQDPLDYFRAYHTTMDTYERLSLNDLKVNAAIVAWLAYSAAMDNTHIPVKPGFPKNPD
ncbi:MAG: M20/M25/M40 family metallo-hydrolase [Muribaculaceae bacterium]|nr:M20/M25/M40 family metallo-hydrolase [Muribaculaceae bacterium]